MALFAAANRAPYQTYAKSLAGKKRKQGSTDSQPVLTEHDATSAAARPKKSRDNKEKYNPKYMAEMCFGAYKARLHKAGFQQYTKDVANDWREDLVEIFGHAALSGVIKQDTAARHVVPRLVLLTPRTNEKKDELVKDFAKHYESVRSDMVVIHRIMLSEDSVAEVRKCLYSLHNALDKGKIWRNIMPYTPLPLPLHRLRALRNLIKCSRPYHFLRHLVTNIDDIETWLTSPPASLELPTGLLNEAMDTLQEATEAKIAKTSIGPKAQEMAEYREQKAERQRLEKEDQARQLEHARLDTLQRLKAEQEQMKKDIKSLELAAAKERAQESARKISEAAATAEREKSYQNQITRNTTEIGLLSNSLTNLAGVQAQKTQPEFTSTPSLPVGPGQLGMSMGSSFSSNQTPSSSVYQPQSSLGTSFGSSTGGNSHGQPGSFGRIPHQSTPDDDGVPMEDVQGIGISPKHLTNFGPRISIAGQSHPFGARVGDGVFSQLPGLSDGDFKPACFAYKKGNCPAGRNCKMPHTACKFWLKSICRYGGTCIRSHDPFFLTETTLRGQPQPSSTDGRTVVDSDPTLQPSPFSRENPFQSGQQNRTHGSQISNTVDLSGRQAPPTGPRERASIISRSTKDSQPILSQSSKIASDHGGNAFGQQVPLTGPRRRNALSNRITKNDQPISSQSPNFASTNDGNAFSQRSVLSDAVQGPDPKKVTCINNLRGRCNKGVYCQYAHEPCSGFFEGTCIASERCRKSHDPAFLSYSSSDNDGQRVSRSPTRHQRPQNHIEQSFDYIIKARAGNKEKHGKPPQL